MFTDTHCHIYNEYYDNNIEQVYEKMKEANVDRIINNGCDSNSNKEVLNLLGKYSWMYGAIGIHPESADSYTDEDLKYIEEHIDDEKVVAIGEIGLDYYWTKDNKDKQIKVFKDMLFLAEKYKLPVIVHSRDSIQDTYDIIKQYKVKGIMHCYSGSVEMAKEFIKLGFLIGIGGVITFKNAIKLVEVLKAIDIKNISLETDSPYLSPEPYRGKKNEPKNIIEIAKKIAEIKSLDVNEVIDATTLNVSRMFDLKS